MLCGLFLNSVGVDSLLDFGYSDKSQSKDYCGERELTSQWSHFPVSTGKYIFSLNLYQLGQIAPFSTRKSNVAFFPDFCQSTSVLNTRHKCNMTMQF